MRRVQRTTGVRNGNWTLTPQKASQLSLPCQRWVRMEPPSPHQNPRENRTLTFVGVTFNRSLSFRTCVEEIVRKPETNMSLIRVVANTSLGWRKKDPKRSGQHTSVVSLPTLLADDIPGSEETRLYWQNSVLESTKYCALTKAS